MKPTNSVNMVWYPDSGASDHVTTSSNNIQVEDKATFGQSMVIANGKHLAVTNSGRSILNFQSKYILLKEINCILEVEKNLSIYKVCKDNNVRFIFVKSNVSIKDLETIDKVATGEIKDRLYQINLTNHKFVEINFVKKVSLTLWHRQLGHGNERRIREILT